MTADELILPVRLSIASMEMAFPEICSHIRNPDKDTFRLFREVALASVIEKAPEHEPQPTKADVAILVFESPYKYDINPKEKRRVAWIQRLSGTFDPACIMKIINLDAPGPDGICETMTVTFLPTPHVIEVGEFLGQVWDFAYATKN